MECNGSVCAVGERCASECTRTVISDNPEECEIEQVKGCVRTTGT